MPWMTHGQGHDQLDSYKLNTGGHYEGIEGTYATITEQVETVLHQLISKILIDEVSKVDGQKVQEVKIVYNFVGGKSRK